MSNNNLLQQLVQALINQNPSLSQNQQTMATLQKGNRLLTTFAKTTAKLVKK